VAFWLAPVAKVAELGYTLLKTTNRNGNFPTGNI